MKVCSVCNKENSNEGNFCVFCGGTLIEQSRRTVERNRNVEQANLKLKIVIVILAIILALVSVAAIYYGVIRESENEKLISNLRKESNQLHDDKQTLIIENSKYLEKISFFDKNVVFVIDGYGNYYYTYDQMEKVTQGEKEYSFWAYNIEQAKGLGYRAWK